MIVLILAMLPTHVKRFNLAKERRSSHANASIKSRPSNALLRRPLRGTQRRPWIAMTNVLNFNATLS
jgi:hypothetical protein